MKFYPSDWRADPALRMCSVAARGLWMEMLCVMHEADPYGSLRVNGKPVSAGQLAALAGASAKDVSGWLSELEDAGVFSRDDDSAIISRRMQRDKVKTESDKANGKRGGNPRLSRGVNPPVNGEDKAQKPEARSQKETTPSGVVSGAPLEDIDGLTARLIEAAGSENIQPHGALDLSPILGLMAAGVDLDTDILPAIRAKAQRLRRPAGSWAYFVEPIKDAHARRIEAGQGVVPQPAFDNSEKRWRTRLAMARERRQWSGADWGPPPGKAGCRVPAHLIDPGDGDNWTEWQSEAA